MLRHCDVPAPAERDRIMYSIITMCTPLTFTGMAIMIIIIIMIVAMMIIMPLTFMVPVKSIIIIMIMIITPLTFIIILCTGISSIYTVVYMC